MSEFIDNDQSEVNQQRKPKNRTEALEWQRLNKRRDRYMSSRIRRVIGKKGRK